MYILEAAVTLNNVEVENDQNGGLDGIDGSRVRSLTMNGGKVEMENPAGGDAIYAYQAPVALNGVTILNGGGAEDAGRRCERKGLALPDQHAHLGGKRTAPVSRGHGSRQLR